MPPNESANLQRQFDVLLDHLPAGVVVHGPDGRILSANRRAKVLLGHSVEELIGAESSQVVWSLVRADNTVMPEPEYPVNQVLSTGDPVSDLVVGVPATPPGPVRWLICNAYPERGRDGRIERVVVCFTDCTKLKLAEHRAQQSEERLRLVLRGSTDASWDYDLRNGEVHYSERWWEMLGYRVGDLPIDAHTWQKVLHPDDFRRVTGFLHDLLGGTTDSYSVEFRMVHRDGHAVPILSRGFILRDEDGLPLRISGTNTDLTERKQVEQRIHELAYFDHLTGLPNRRFLAEELDKVLARSERSGQFGAVLFLDLDNFKLLNDTMGHDIGDLLLRQVALRLKLALRHSDQLARLGGDEFVVVFEDLGTTLEDAIAEANHVVDKILEVLDQPYHLDGRLFVSTTSIGVTLFEGMGADVDTLLKQADLAMYRAKADGRHIARFFDPGMQAAANRQSALETGLRDGLARHEFVLYCQPQFDTHGRLVGAEVLVRWRRDSGVLVAPGDFIGLAESSGLILPLGRQVLEESCRALARWAGDRALGKLKLAVNVSVQQLRDPEFPDEVARILARSGAPAGQLFLELTESIFADDKQDLAERMHLLCGQGLRFSLDDFGTGYSSLAYLKQFPLTALKIDRSFVHDVHVDPSAGPIVKAIIALAQQLKLEIVAEGVEHEAQRTFLARNGCSALQGYLLGAPMPIAEFESLYSATGIGHA
ncbi:bifunctional diguanylate cyclase/phosphodiesterase [Massilia sp. Mn16-1_5]|uniref:bifunctional diguanylate cyclase/phosphodiesterase n=1 Tax=Massilia sp. Mn16-1_5 TaxID=2079199 RepID=UPI00109E4B0E|nr:bifunctional diguanylate cyclase/phosphodiesterase [Massilia sp. Mn16-1_5]THC46903.1 PAS domain S-box protein [Massilia sp. Mn16-1_5]